MPCGILGTVIEIVKCNLNPLPRALSNANEQKLSLYDSTCIMFPCCGLQLDPMHCSTAGEVLKGGYRVEKKTSEAIYIESILIMKVEEDLQFSVEWCAWDNNLFS